MQRNEIIAERFVLEEVAGRGGMGVVWRAFDQQTQQRVALKELLPGSRGQERFARESWILSQLSHPHIVRHLSHGETSSGELFLVMEWLEGEELATRLTRGPLSQDETMTLLAQLASALSHAHHQGVIHRDLKPSNLYLVNKDLRQLRLLDFGIARPTDSLYDMTRTGLMIGTPGYMAPEQAVRGAKGLDARADLFALGCILFECLTGQRAFAGENALAVLSKILLHEPPRVEELGVTVSTALSSLVSRLLSKNVATRPADAGALLTELQGLSSTLAVVSAEPQLTLLERRFFAMLLLSKPSLTTSVGASLAEGLAPTRADANTQLEAMQSRAAIFHGELTPLIEGSVLISFQRAGSAVELATSAARCALSLRDLTSAPISLSVGRAEQVQQRFIGEAIDRAATMLQRSASKIIIDPVAAGLLEGKFSLQEEAGQIYLEHEHAAPKARTLLGRPGVCVGRERELSLLEATFRHCIDEETTRAALVIAPAGVGKSRLREEFLHRIEGETYLLLQCHGDAMREGSPFAMLSEALRGYFGLRPSDSQEESQQKIKETLSRRLGGVLSVNCGAFLGELMKVHFSAEEHPDLRAARQDAAFMGDQMRRCFLEWLYAERQRQPVLFLLEDLHWGDPPTVSFMESALRESPEGPLMILATARPEVKQVLGDFWRGKEEIQLSELSRKASERLIKGALGDTLSAAMQQRLFAISGGNAFYLEELIRAVHEGRGDELPDTVLAMASARLERLSAPARRVLRAASVFGERSWHSAILALAQEPYITAIIAELQQDEVLVSCGEGRFEGQEEYSFRHALLREATYATLTQQDKILGHRLAAQWLEEQREPDARTLASHWEHGEEPGRAIRCYLRAAEQALEGNDLRGALSCTSQARRCGAQGDELGRLRQLEAEAHNWLGAFQEGLNCALEAMGLLQGELWFRALGEGALSAGRIGDVGLLLSLYQQLNALPWPTLIGGNQLVSSVRLVLPLNRHGHRQEAQQLIERMLRHLSDEALSVWEQAWVQILRGVKNYLEGDPSGWMRGSADAAVLFEKIGDRRNACANMSDMAFIAMALGDTKTSIETARSALQIAESLQLARIIAMSSSTLGFSLVVEERFEESAVPLQRAIQLFREQGDLSMQVGAMAVLGRSLLQQGDVEGAQALLEKTPTSTTPAVSVQRVLFEGVVHLHAGRFQEAADCLSPVALLSLPAWVELAYANYHKNLYAEALWGLGRKDEARAIAKQTIERLQRYKRRITDEVLRESYTRRKETNHATLLLERWAKEGQ